jgi:hypothetical protein
MPPANLGKSSEVYELPHSSTIGSQWMIEKDYKKKKMKQMQQYSRFYLILQ